MQTQTKGYTLLEMLIAITIMGLLIGIGTPGFSYFLGKNRAHVAMDEIFRAYQFARTYAVHNHTKVYFCGSNTGNRCDKQWSKFLLVFIDKDGNKTPDPTEIIQYQILNPPTATIVSRLGFGKPYTILHPDGSAALTGSMIYCPNNKKPGMVNRVTWNDIGRPYMGVDFNKDGIIDDTNGRNLLNACP